MANPSIIIDSSLDNLTEPLGFKFDALMPDGLPRDRVQMVKTDNSRRAREDPSMEERILNYFIKSSGPNSFNAPRARFEGVMDVGGTLLVLYSEDWYATHFYTRNTVLPRNRKGDPLSINGMVLTADHKLPYGLRNPLTTDQGKTYHIVPAGFTDVQPIIEEPMDTAIRKLINEMGFRGKYVSEGPHLAASREFSEELNSEAIERLANDMLLIAVTYNARKNFDTTLAITIPVGSYSSQIALRGAEHTQLEFVDLETSALTSLLFNFSLAPDTNSGHLRGDIAALIAHRSGIDALKSSLHEVHTQLADYQR